MEDMLKKMDPSSLRSKLVLSSDDNDDDDDDLLVQQKRDQEYEELYHRPPSKKFKHWHLTNTNSIPGDHDEDDNDHPPHPSALNQYTGWTVPCKNYIITTIHITTNNLTPEKFFSDYIALRRPVVIQGIPEDLLQLQKWTDEYIRGKAGEEQIMVEKRDSVQDSFGKGNEIPMTFGDFIEKVKEGDDMHYLTTQDVLSNEDGRPDLMAPFMKRLKESFPLVPELTRNLVTQNINLWMGNNKEGTSSGLHHDYHDNLYIVLRGTKRFRLFGPDDAEKVYTRGELVKVHPNGRINYKGEETTAYGADLKADAAARASTAKDEAERLLEEAERAVKEGRSGAKEEYERAEEMMEVAMEAMIDAEMGDSDDDDEGDDDEDEDGLENVGVMGLFGNAGDLEDDEEDDKMDEDCKLSAEEGENDAVDFTKPRFVDKTVKNPDNFSLIDSNLLDYEDKLRIEYPLAVKAKAAFCEVHTGEMLYLPASWLHEVASFGSKQGHMALNYWFHPPDALDNFDKPYSTDFWPNDFRQRFETNL
mmetsp:Transcript_19959/g.29431  ORF Transcript_19959/g.29431 Transcript_19959/m.29431 type:complete len:531 (+) Transcript_19959:429-2021(+)